MNVDEDYIYKSEANEKPLDRLIKAIARQNYERAGYVPEVVQVDKTYIQEDRRECSYEYCQVLAKLFIDDKLSSVLKEALQLLIEHNKIVPASILVDLLQVQKKEIQPLVAQVIGKRGKWLAQHQESWKWAATAKSVQNEDGISKKIWDFGSSEQRLKHLGEIHASQPELAISWIEESFAKEKADFRRQIVETITSSVVDSDQAFLEKAAKDRTASVKYQVTAALVRLPQSNTSKKIYGLAHSILTLHDSKRSVEIHIPPLDDSYKSLGISDKSPHRLIGTGAWTIFQVLSLIEPSYWEKYLRTPIEKLVKMLQQNEFGEVVLAALINAALRYRTTSYYNLLWHASFKRPHPINILVHDAHGRLLEAMPLEDRDVVGLTILKQKKEMLLRLAAPWPESFSEHILKHIYGKNVGPAFLLEIATRMALKKIPEPELNDKMSDKQASLIFFAKEINKVLELRCQLHKEITCE